MDRPSFVSESAAKYNGERASFSQWCTTPLGRYVLDWERGQFDSAVEDVFGFRAMQVWLPELDFLRQNRIAYRFSLALEAGAAVAADPLQLPVASHSLDLVARADWIVELGPGGGVHGGHLLFSGPFDDFLERGQGPTAEELRRFVQWPAREALAG